MQAGNWNCLIQSLWLDTLATLRFGHLGHHFMKPGDSEHTSVSNILHFLQGAGLLNEWAKELQKRSILAECTGHSVPAPVYSILYQMLQYLTSSSVFQCPSYLGPFQTNIWFVTSMIQDNWPAIPQNLSTNYNQSLFCNILESTATH